MGYAAGHGHRRLAARAGLPASTVRNWLRGFAGHADALRQLGTRRYAELDANSCPIEPAATPAGDAVEALAMAARAVRLRLGRSESPWMLINLITAGQLLTAAGRLPN